MLTKIKEVTRETAESICNEIHNEAKVLQEYGCKIKIGKPYYADNRIYTRLTVYTDEDKVEVISALNEILDNIKKINGFWMNDLNGFPDGNEIDIDIRLYTTDDQGNRKNSADKLKMIA